MELFISSKTNNAITLTLQHGHTIIDTVDFSFDKNLDDVLIQTIDKFLKRNRIDTFALYAITVDSGIDPVSSCAKILQTFATAVGIIQKQR